MLSTELVAGSNARPLLSGYYHMMATVLSLAEQAGLFEQAGEGRAQPPGYQQVMFVLLVPMLKCCLVVRR